MSKIDIRGTISPKVNKCLLLFILALPSTATAYVATGAVVQRRARPEASAATPTGELAVASSARPPRRSLLAVKRAAAAALLGVSLGANVPTAPVGKASGLCPTS